MRSKENLVKLSALSSLIVLLAASCYFLISGWSGGHFKSTDALRDYVASFGVWAPLILTLLQLCLSVLPVCPTFMGYVAGAALFGMVGGFCTNYIGICVGSILDYVLARHFGVEFVNKMIPMHKYESYIEKINRSKSYPKLLFLAILLPLAPDNFLCYFSGLIKMPAQKFVTIILLAKPWCILVYSIVFANIF